MYHHVKSMESIKTLSVQDISSHMFVISFENQIDMQKVIRGCPYLFDYFLLSLKMFDGCTPPSRMDFAKETFWVLMQNLPLTCMNDDVESQVGSTIGKVMTYDVKENGTAWGHALRVFIELDLHKPIARGRTSNLKGIKSWVPLTYEKLPQLYFNCGRIPHEQ